MKRIVVLGSTGSIGRQTLDVVRSFPQNFKIVGLAAGSRGEKLSEQITEFLPEMIFCNEKNFLQNNNFDSSCHLVSMEEMVVQENVDIVVVATSGDVAMNPIVNAIRAGKIIALANKEPIVIAGKFLTDLARACQAEIRPLDSEPNAIWQCLQGDPSVSNVIITASGGALRDWDITELYNVKVKDALNHPNWQMGEKITIDSATMMNKVFEVIEAHWLFGLSWSQISVYVHPESLIHSMVEFVDGSIKAALASPDMRIPIQYGLFYPDRFFNPNVSRLDLLAQKNLNFSPLDNKRYPCFNIALEYAKKEGTWPAVLVGIDEVVVETFLNGKLKFGEIPKVFEKVLSQYVDHNDGSLKAMIDAVKWSKLNTYEIVNSIGDNDA